ncbi:hypothetical protein V6N11_008365 [Hibiscus sabdariffa]|uniref:Uncharacterized protein n=2 Tax=Hibiscus sabdariffa TaxID=183260 RepID=A0ABR2NMS7_9ROSI
MGAASTDLAALSFGVLTFPFPFSLVSAPVNFLRVVTVIMVPLIINASSESTFGTLCLMETLVINKGKKRLVVPFLIHLNFSSTIMRPTFICRPMMIECNMAIRSSKPILLYDFGIKLAFKMWFQP